MQFDMAPEGGLGAPKMVNIQGRNHPSADGLIDRSHRGSTDRGLYCVGSECTMFIPPVAENNFTAMVRMKVRYVHPNDPTNVLTWEDGGDANAQNCSGGVAQHFIRMAFTRALSRAHGQALNIAEAVAEEIANGGSGQQAVQNYQQAQNPQQYQQQAPQQGSVAPSAIQAMFPGVASWKFTVRTGANAKKQIDDPSVTLEDLQFHLNRGFFTKNQQTGQYDVPDPQSAQIYQAEIARRMGGHIGQVPQPMPQQPAQQSPQPLPNYGQAAPQPMQQAQPQYQPPAQPQQDLNWNAQNHLPKLLNASKSFGAKWPDVIQWCQASFNGKDPAHLSRDEFDMALVAYGGMPLS